MMSRRRLMLLSSFPQQKTNNKNSDKKTIRDVMITLPPAIIFPVAIKILCFSSAVLSSGAHGVVPYLPREAQTTHNICLCCGKITTPRNNRVYDFTEQPNPNRNQSRLCQLSGHSRSALCGPNLPSPRSPAGKSSAA